MNVGYYHNVDGKRIKFEPDSSPEAWEYYKKIYTQRSEFIEKYDMDNILFYTHYDRRGCKRGVHKDEIWFNYANIPAIEGYNRWFAIEKNARYYTTRDGIKHFVASRRLGGDCDFNFNEKKCKLFNLFINSDNIVATEQLERCKGNHHELINFSLMEAIGDLQGFKGRNRFDRFDTFVSELDAYFSGSSSLILSAATNQNRGMLIEYLNEFRDVYDYCRQVYFIRDTAFIDEIIRNGRISIKDEEDVIRYMTLAESYWKIKAGAINELLWIHEEI